MMYLNVLNVLMLEFIASMNCKKVVLMKIK